jgi:hypothetical protein
MTGRSSTPAPDSFLRDDAGECLQRWSKPGQNTIASRSAFILRSISSIALWPVEFPKLYLDTSFAFLVKRFA